jgi:hypothetical protein
MNSWSVDSFEDEESSWAGAGWGRSLKLAEQDYEQYKPRPTSFAEEPEPPTYDPWTGGWF